MSATPQKMPSDHPGPLPRVFGRYVLFDRIGRGGMADIYLARADTALGGSRLCVVKQILPELGRDSAFERMLVEEAKLAARLTNANVVQVFDLGRESDRLFIGMEYVEGFDLNQLLRALSKAKVPLPAEFALFIIREVLRALDHAHRLRDETGEPFGLVHRDVSPSNVLISFEGEVKLCDFGIARALTSQDEQVSPDTMPRRGRLVGKSAYMAPEHARGEPIDARADVFAAGILLWELCAGRRLYKGSEEEMLALAQQADVPPLPDRGLPQQEALQGVLNRALSRFRDDRYQSAAELLHDLEDYAISVKLMASQLRFGTFLTEHFADDIVAVRRERERAARSMPSEIPPALAPHTVPSGAAAQLASEPEAQDDAPTTIGEAPPPTGEEEVLSASQAMRRRWSEPGAIDAPEREPDAGRVVMQERGQGEAASPVPARQASDVELDQSLMGLDALAEQTQAELQREARRISSVSPASPVRVPVPMIEPFQESSGEWLWYGAALAILGASLLAYLLM